MAQVNITDVTGSAHKDLHCSGVETALLGDLESCTLCYDKALMNELRTLAAEIWTVFTDRRRKESREGKREEGPGWRDRQMEGWRDLVTDRSYSLHCHFLNCVPRWYSGVTLTVTAWFKRTQKSPLLLLVWGFLATPEH